MWTLLFVALCVAGVGAAARGPVIGIVTQDNESNWPPRGNQTYIAASYVKYVEAGGARVVPIFYSRGDAYLESMVGF